MQVAQEYEIQRIIKRDSDIPVAKVLHLSTNEEKAVVGAKFMVMTFVQVRTHCILMIGMCSVTVAYIYSNVDPITL